jgi:hypothetical protein
MRLAWTVWSLLTVASSTLASPYRDDLVQYNLNKNQNAQSPLDYTTSRSNTTYTPSPPNWRAIPFYTILLDKFADGDPSNNDFFSTPFEYDWRETQLRSGGDLQGLLNKLDYLSGMGVKGIFCSGTVFLNMLWQADSGCFVTCLVIFCAKLFCRLFPTRFHCTGPTLRNTAGVAECHRPDPCSWHVLHGRLHCRYHG